MYKLVVSESVTLDGVMQPPQQMVRLGFVTVWVRDQERSRQFFVEQLGFHVAIDTEVPSGRWIVVAPPAGLPGLALVVAHPGSAEERRIGQHTRVTLLAEDVEAVFEEWSRRGVRFESSPRHPSWGKGQARHAFFEDVDGNRCSIVGIDEATRAFEQERRAKLEKLEAERQAAYDLAVAKEVQSRLFPQRHPRLRTLAYAGKCLQARTVGGDYFDFLDLGEGKLGLAIGDIVGKGMAAALLMANLQANLRSQCATAWEHPRQFLHSVNRLFYENSAERDYATVFFAAYDDGTQRLHYSNCGHPPGLLLKRDGTLERLEPTSTVIGMFEHWDCVIEERQLFPGDILVLYTDGATETSNAVGEELGEERLIEVVRQYRHLPARELLDGILEQVRRFSTKEQADDITLIVAKCD